MDNTKVTVHNKNNCVLQTITNYKYKQMIMTYFSARSLHRRLLDLLYFASKFLQLFAHRTLGKLKLKNCRHSLSISMLFVLNSFMKKRLTVKWRDE